MTENPVERPLFKCRKDNIEAYYYKTIADNIWMVQCFACGAKGVYNLTNKTLVPYNKNPNWHTLEKGNKKVFNIYLEGFV